MNSELADLQNRKNEMLTYERGLWTKGILRIAGIDEVGRGSLAGPVVAAAVLFPPTFFLEEVDDSKQLSNSQREALYDQIMAGALAIGVGMVDHSTIDEINILNATFRAMHEAVAHLSVRPEHMLIDGNRFVDNGIPFTTIIGGDARSFSVAGASIIAKVTRDRMMMEFDRQFPEYGFATNKGYATDEHREAIFKFGYCSIHRLSFTLKSQIELEF